MPGATQLTGHDLLRLFPLTANALLAGISIWLARRYPRPFARAWMLAFVMAFATNALDFLSVESGRPKWLTGFGLVAVTGFNYFGLEALFLLRGAPRAPAWRLPVVGGALVLSLGLWLSGSPLETAVVAPVLLDMGVQIALGVTLVRAQSLGERFGTRLLGWALIANGAWALAYPVLVNTPWDWIGYWANGALLLMVAVGLAVYLFERDARELNLLIGAGRQHAFVLLDEQLRIASWNHGAQRLFGVAAAEMLGRTPDALGIALQPSTPSQVSGWCQAQGGRRFWAETTLAPVVDDAGHGHGYSMMVRDLSDRREVEEERTRLVAAAQQIEDGLAIADARGAVRYLNPAFEERCGISSAQAAGRPVEELLAAADPAELAGLREALRAGAHFSGRLRTLGPKGERTTEQVRVTPLRREGELTDLLVLRRDVTFELQLQEHLYQAQKSEEIGRLVGGITHDVTNLMSIITSALDLLDHGVGQPADRLAAIRRATQRTVELTRKLLLFSRRDVAVPRRVDLNRVVSEVVAMLGRVLGHNVELRTRLDPEVGCAYLDPIQLEQVITNLVINARDALGGEQGSITVSTSEELPAPGCDPAGRFAVLAVSDTGQGIDAATLERIFEPYFTTKPAGKGTGLGLAVVQGIVSGAGGLIEVESAPGRGSTFRVKLPWRPQPEEPAPSQAAASAPRAEESGPAAPSAVVEPPFGAGRSVLVVEDELELLDPLARLLEEQGFHVLPAENPLKAMELFVEHQERIALLVTDVVMPQMSGGNLAAALRQQRADLKVLFMSGYPDDPKVRAEIAAGAPFIAKPYGPEAMARKVKEVLTR